MVLYVILNISMNFVDIEKLCFEFQYIIGYQNISAIDQYIFRSFVSKIFKNSLQLTKRMHNFQELKNLTKLDLNYW